MIINVHQLNYRYPHTEKNCLQDITFSVRKGECLGIIGRNGSGKSSLCYAIMGLIPHFYHGAISGDVWVNGVNVPDSNMAEMAHHVGLVFQNPYNQLSGSKQTVAEEIAFGLENIGLARQEMIERIDWVSSTFRIKHLLDRNPYQLSGGQMQRVAIASVLAMKPKILVMDEPTSQLDPAGTEEVFQCVATLQKEGITVILVEHKVDLLAMYCDRIAILSEGHLKAIAKPNQIFAHPQLREWGLEPPVFTQAYLAVTDQVSSDVPSTLTETIERLKII